MDLINTLNKSLTRYRNKEKMEKLLDLIDYFEVDGSKAVIKLNKDIALVSNGSIINICKGYNVTFAHQIHLNPNVSVSKVFEDDFVECLEESKEIEQGCLIEPENTCLKKETTCSHENHS